MTEKKTKRKNTGQSDINEKNLLRIFNKEKQPLGLGYLNGIFPKGRNERKALKRALNDLVKKGLVVKMKNDTYGIADEMNLIAGTLSCTRSGNGFVIPSKEKIPDIFIPARFLKNAFHGDEVIARIDQIYRGRREGKILRITARHTNNIIGFIKQHKNQLYVTPEDTRYSNTFMVADPDSKVALEDGSLVAAKITQFPDNDMNSECQIVKVFKNGLNDVAAIGHFIEYKYNLPARFKRSTELEASALGPLVKEKDRLDLRKLKHVTIDGELAKDFDDAVCVEKNPEGYRLFVSIADVSAYVTSGSRLDGEAYERGTSIYFPGKVLPMLPKALSDGLCSLNPAEDKQAVTVQIQYSRNGDILSTAFNTSLIRSVRRLTYRQVEEAVVRGNKEVRKGLRGLLKPLEDMAELARLLQTKRVQRGSLDFDLPEPEVILDIEGGVKEIIRSERLFSHQLIEEFMVSANEAVARFLRDRKLPALYRVHEAPEKEKLGDIERLLHTMPIESKAVSADNHFLQSVLKSVAGTDYEFFVNRVLLRSMKQARYSPYNKGHFGLASECYLHFTSPIRRYPDLVCHRSVKTALFGTKPQTDEDLERMAAHLSDRERVAMEAERELEDRIRILFMKDKVGRVYRGIISHITAYGFFVELNDIFVEGLVLLADLSNDYYHFEEEKFRLVGKRTRKIYRIGDKITVRVATADVETNRLHFMPVFKGRG